MGWDLKKGLEAAWRTFKEKEKHKGDEVQKPFPGKEQEKSPKTVKNETDFCSLTRLWLQKGDSENTEGLKAEYQGNKTRYKL